MNRLFISLLLCTTQLSAQIPDTLKSDWNLSGLDQEFIYPATILDATAFGAIPNDGLDDRGALMSAMASLPAGGAVIYFPPGTYNFNAPVNLPSNCIIKGAGADSTGFIFNMGNAMVNCFNTTGSPSNNFRPVTGGLSKGSRTLTIANAGTFFSPGQRIELRQANGSWDTNPAAWAAFSVGHVTTIDSIQGDSIFIREGLRIDFDTALNPEVQVITCIENSGLECFRMLRADSLATGVNYGIYFNYAYNCFVKGVESYKSIGAHCMAEISAHLQISNCYFHESYAYDGSSTRGYGVIMGVHTVLTRVENNIFRKLRHAMMVKQGANGNVFGYNYSREPNRSEFPANYGADINVHGHYPFANLFEGNQCQNMIIDQAWGPAGPYNTFFRNRAELYGMIISPGTVQSDRQTIAANDITSTAAFQGMYTLNGTGHYQQGNRVQGNVIPVGTTALPDTSLYLDSPPVFWRSIYAWPSIGLPVALATNQVPAAGRWLSGNNLSPCSDDPDSSVTTVITEPVNNVEMVLRSIVYKDNQIEIDLQVPSAGEYRCFITDLLGRMISSSIIKAIENRQQFSIPLAPADGNYLITIASEFGRITGKLLIR